MQALKEWAVACRALEEGKQVVILRKGGILEYRRGFEINHKWFWLFPTFEHQSREHIKPEYWSLLDSIDNGAPNPGLNVITSYAHVTQLWDLTNASDLRSLDKFHIWTEEYVWKRMNYNPAKPISILLLRVYKSRHPLRLENKEEWAGCKSWVPIEAESEGDPVLDDPSFDRLSNKVREALLLAA